MRHLVQPGPVHPVRIESFAADARPLTFTARAGETILDAMTAPLVAAGFQAAVLRFHDAAAHPFVYVKPDTAPDETHVAYFSQPHAPAGQTRIEQAAATFGWHSGGPFLHCHAAWIEPDGQRRGGHILNGDSRLAADVTVEAWGFDSLRIETAEDAETNFPLFQPSGMSSPGANAILARVKPNQDIVTAIETIARAMPNATIRGSLGSLIGAVFDDGRTVPDLAAEVLITGGHVRDGIAVLDAAVVDMAGRVHQGRLARGENPVLITFDLVLTRDPWPGDPS